MNWVNQSRKAIGAFLTAALAWGAEVVASDPAKITGSEWIGLAGIAVTTLTVYFLTNEPAPVAPPAPLQAPRG